VAVRNRLYPDAGQEPALVRTCDHARFVWNLDAEQQSCWPGCSGRAGVSLPFCAGSPRSIVFAGIRAVPSEGVPGSECSIAFRATANNTSRLGARRHAPRGKCPIAEWMASFL
jgi:Helix-turn-helix domain